jgi:hypothetical protein
MVKPIGSCFRRASTPSHEMKRVPQPEPLPPLDRIARVADSPGNGSDHPHRKARRRSLLWASIAMLPLSTPLARPPSAGSAPARLPRLESWELALREAGREGEPLVILWGSTGCPWCEALRRDVLVHVWRESAQRGVRVHEFDLADNRPLEGAPELTPAQMATRLNIRVSPTVSFHGPGGELAPRLIGYPSRDFYLSYLEDRLLQARNKLRP